MSLPIMPTRILIVGGGGREHALAWKLAAEPGVNLVVVAPGSTAIGREARVRCVSGVDPLAAAELLELARREAVELAVIGPEAALAAGLADVLRAGGVTTFGPSQAAARIESSKAFCREVAAAAGVRTAQGRAFSTLLEAEVFAHALASSGDGVVIKADGLAAGKGVTVCRDGAEATAALEAIFAGGEPLDGRALAVVEERLVGPEASVIALCDGTTAVVLPAARDHKRLLDGDAGPNTGGMGAYSPLPDLLPSAVDDIVERFHRPVLAELARRGTPFIGALYAGVILTAEGPVLLEFNARFGDPETQVLMPRLAGPLGPWLLAAAKGRLGSASTALGAGASSLPVVPGAAVGIVLASSGYPGSPRNGDAIAGLETARREGLVFASGIALDADGAERTSGGRVLTVVGTGRDLPAARIVAETLAEAVRFDGLQRRHDVAAEPPAAGNHTALAERQQVGAAR